jgi:hypothetical protein
MIFLDICMMYEVPYMFYIDFEDFPRSPLLFVYNAIEQETPILRIFEFEGPSGRQTVPKFLPRHFFGKSEMMRRSARGGQRGA